MKSPPGGGFSWSDACVSGVVILLQPVSNVGSSAWTISYSVAFDCAVHEISSSAVTSRTPENDTMAHGVRVPE